MKNGTNARQEFNALFSAPCVRYEARKIDGQVYRAGDFSEYRPTGFGVYDTIAQGFVAVGSRKGCPSAYARKYTAQALVDSYNAMTIQGQGEALTVVWSEQEIATDEALERSLL